MTAYGRHVRREGCRFRTKSHEVGIAMWSSRVQPINTLPAAGTAKRARSYARATTMMPTSRTTLAFWGSPSSTPPTSISPSLFVRCTVTWSRGSGDPCRAFSIPMVLHVVANLSGAPIFADGNLASMEPRYSVVSLVFSSPFPYWQYNVSSIERARFICPLLPCFDCRCIPQGTWSVAHKYAKSLLDSSHADERLSWACKVSCGPRAAEDLSASK